MSHDSTASRNVALATADRVFAIRATTDDFGRIISARVESDERADLVGQRCYSAFAGRPEPCVECPLLSERDGAASVVVLTQTGDKPYVVVNTAHRAEAVVVVQERPIDEDLVARLQDARVKRLADRARLTGRERQVLQLMLLGRTVADIGVVLGVREADREVPPEERPRQARGGFAARLPAHRARALGPIGQPYGPARRGPSTTGVDGMSEHEPQQAARADLHGAIIDNLPVMVFVKDAAELRFVLVNRVAEQVLGRTRAELLGRTDHDFFTKEQADFFQSKDRETLAATGAVAVIEEPVSTPGGARWLRTLKIALRDDAGVARYLLGVSEDITAKRALQEELRQAQKMEWMGKLAAGVAHDVNNLLTVIIGCAELAAVALHAGDPVRDDVAEVALAGWRAADLTRQLMTFTRVQPLRSENVDLNRVVANLEKILRRLLEKSIHVLTVPGASWLLCAEPSALDSVLMNLVVNARDAMPNGGRLTIETANVEPDDGAAKTEPSGLSGPHVMLSVSDTGQGMDQETLARVFEPFFTTKPSGVGTGLGLSNVQSVVCQLGGKIHIDSAVGVGTTVKVYLPRAQDCAGDARAKDAVQAVAERGSETVLVVDDDEQLLRVVSSVLRRHGYNVLSANGPAEALLVSEQHKGEIDLMLSDVVMPLLDGPQLTERLRRARPAIKVAFMSGYAANAIHRQEPLAPGVVLIAKPFSTVGLLKQLREVLRS